MVGREGRRAIQTHSEAAAAAAAAATKEREERGKRARRTKGPKNAPRDEKRFDKHVRSKLLVVLRRIKIEVLQEGVDTHDGHVIALLQHRNVRLITVVLPVRLPLQECLLHLEEAVIQRHGQLLNKAAAEGDFQEGVHLSPEALDGVKGDFPVRGLEIGAWVGESAKQAANLHQKRLLISLADKLVFPLRHLPCLWPLPLLQFGAVRLAVL